MPRKAPVSTDLYRNARYLEETITTAPPAKLLTMLYDRLVLDLANGEDALRSADPERAATALGHARDIVTELLASLDGRRWEGARGLAQLYSWFLSQLIQAGIRKDSDLVATCRVMVDDLRAAWHQAAESQLSAERQSA
jgi:flagellar protein FliS